MSRLLLSAIAAVVIAAPVAAHHETAGKSHAVATVTITEPVRADGKPLAPGTYEVWILDDRPNLNAGAPSNAQRVVELHQNGKMVAREVAEVFPASERPVGTSGTSGSKMAKAAVQKLQGGEYLRVAINDGGARYLIHLPTANFSEPTPRPQAPSRVVVPPPAVEVPQPAPPQQ
jgi:hypothetical protein